MKKSITFTSASGIGTNDLADYSWNGKEFTTETVVFSDEEIDEQYAKAIDYLRNSEKFEAVYLWPENYNFRIKFFNR